MILKIFVLKIQGMFENFDEEFTKYFSIFFYKRKCCFKSTYIDDIEMMFALWLLVFKWKHVSKILLRCRKCTFLVHLTYKYYTTVQIFYGCENFRYMVKLAQNCTKIVHFRYNFSTVFKFSTNIHKILQNWCMVKLFQKFTLKSQILKSYTKLIQLQKVF